MFDVITSANIHTSSVLFSPNEYCVDGNISIFNESPAFIEFTFNVIIDIPSFPVSTPLSATLSSISSVILASGVKLLENATFTSISFKFWLVVFLITNSDFTVPPLVNSISFDEPLNMFTCNSALLMLFFIVEIVSFNPLSSETTVIVPWVSVPSIFSLFNIYTEASYSNVLLSPFFRLEIVPNVISFEFEIS